MAYSGTSIVDYLKSIGRDSSYAVRKALAAQYGITNYSGTAEQNLALLDKLRGATATTTTPQSSTTITPVKTGVITTGGTVTGTPTTTTSAPKTTTTTTPKAPDISGLIGLREYATNKGLNVTWNAQQGAMINGIPVDTSRLKLSDGRFYGTKADIDNVLSQFVPADMSAVDITSQKDTYKGAQSNLADISADAQAWENQWKPDETLDAFKSRQMAEIERQIADLKNSGTGAISQARGDINTEASEAQRKLDLAFQQQIDDLKRQADEIRAAYDANRRNLETQRSIDMPEFQSQRVQADTQTQQAAKRIIDYFARRGLSSGGQVASELAGTYNAGLGQQAAIGRGEANYLRQYADNVADVEGKRAIDLADVERLSGRAGATLQAGKSDIVGRVQNALSKLDIDEKNLLVEIANKRQSLMEGIEPQYKEMTEKEKETDWSRYLAVLGLRADAVKDITALADGIRAAAVQDKELSISQQNANIAAGNLDARVREAQDKGGLTLSDYFSLGKEMLQAGSWTGEGDAKTFMAKYSPNEIRDWAFGLPLDDAEIAKLLSSLGIPK